LKEDVNTYAPAQKQGLNTRENLWEGLNFGIMEPWRRDRRDRVGKEEHNCRMRVSPRKKTGAKKRKEKSTTRRKKNTYGERLGHFKTNTMR